MLSAYEFLISHILVVLLGILGLSGLNRPPDRAAGPPGRSVEAALAPELEGLGNLSMPVSTKVPRAQRFFDQGLRLLYAFNHQEARRAFQRRLGSIPHSPWPTGDTRWRCRPISTRR
jgi:hypothetical protein